MMYIRTTADYLTYAYVGDPPENCSIGLFADADFAGCKSTAKSTSGVVVAIVGPSTFFPLAVVSKKQDCVSTSTTEAEIVSMAMGLKKEALPTLDLWESFQGLKVFENIKFRVKSLLAFEDHQSTILCFKQGVSKQLRHLTRTHRVNLAWCSEVVTAENCEIPYIDTENSVPISSPKPLSERTNST